MTAPLMPILATFSPMDMGIIFLVLLIFFGAKKLPEFARSMGQAVREFSKAKDDFEREITRAPEPERPKELEPPKDEAVVTHEEHPADVQIVETHPVEGTQPQEPVHKA
jgi:sec-independent protein translocase protein TatA